MCDILEFRARAGYVRRAAPRPEETGRILFCLGVRYERIEDNGVPKKAVSRRTKPAGAAPRRRAPS